MLEVLTALGRVTAIVPVALVAGAVWGRYLWARAREAHLRDAVAVVVEPPRRDHAATAADVGGWKTALHYEVAGRTWRCVLSLQDHLAVGSAVPLRYDARFPGRAEPSPETLHGLREPWRTAWLFTAFSAVVLGVDVVRQLT